MSEGSLSAEAALLRDYIAGLQREAAGRSELGAEEIPVMVAYGAGLDSTAMSVALLDAGVRIDAVLFADTGSEKPETYGYLEMFSAWLRDRGVVLVVVRYQPKAFKHYPPYATLDENAFTNATLPGISFGRSTCSIKWKVAPQNRWTQDWERARSCWAGGGRVVKLIGYDCSPADAKRYAHAEGYQDPRYAYGYPLRALGWTRPDCERRLVEAGLPVPVKSACFMCAASKPWEIDALPAAQLRRIVLMEARAAPRLRNVEGLWRKSTKGTRGGQARPGRMTDYIRDKGLLPAAEVEEIIALAPTALVRFQEDQATLPVEDRVELGRWMRLFDMRDAGAFTAAGRDRLYNEVRKPGEDQEKSILPSRTSEAA